MGKFDFLIYVLVFGDEIEGMKCVLQVLFGFIDYSVLDLNGCVVYFIELMMVLIFVLGLMIFVNCCVIINGQIVIVFGLVWVICMVGGVGIYNLNQLL